MAEVLLEVCVDTAAGLAAAVAGGADRVELCAALGVGGLTPSRGMMALAAGCGVPVHVLIRPRAGGFRYSQAEIAAMGADVAAARAAGLQGVVIGAAGADGRLELAVLARLVEAARGMAVTLNRVFDLVPDRVEALEAAIGLGCSRVLTSGGAATAADGAAEIGVLVARAAGRIGVLPAGGIRAGNVRALVEATGVREVHASCGRRVAAAARERALGLAPAGARQTDAGEVRRLKAALGGT